MEQENQTSNDLQLNSFINIQKKPKVKHISKYVKNKIKA